MSNWIHHQKTSLRSSSQLLTSLRTGFWLVILLMLGFHPAVGSLGETEDQCAQRYGNPTKVLSFDAASKTKEIFYGRLFEENVRVQFVNGIAIRVEHLGGYSMRNPVIESCLEDNAQGHKWTLSKTEGDDNRTWERDDGGFAMLRPIKMENGDHWLSLAILPPSPKIPLPPESPHPTFMQAVVKPIIWVFTPLAIIVIISEIHRHCTQRKFTD